MAGFPDASAPVPSRGAGPGPFARRLKALRAQHALTQQELADALHISKSSVNMYERGEREPGLDTLAAIADYFGVDMNHLLCKESGPAPAGGRLSAGGGAGGGAGGAEGGGQRPGAPGSARQPARADIAQTPRERKVLLLARRASDLPKAQYDRLVKNFEDTIDLYLEAMGIPLEDG